jgi:hypothetical protein
MLNEMAMNLTNLYKSDSFLRQPHPLVKIDEPTISSEPGIAWRELFFMMFSACVNP